MKLNMKTSMMMVSSTTTAARRWVVPVLLVVLMVVAHPTKTTASAASTLPSFMDHYRLITHNNDLFRDLPKSSTRPIYNKKTTKRRVLQSAESADRMLQFGDYAQYPDTCPFTTTCPTICVAQVEDCPTTCPDGTELCEWGNCMEDCSMETNVVENPCACESLSFACPNVVDVYEVCFEVFQAYYNASNECIAAQEDSVPLVSFTGPWFMACYLTIGIATGLVILWCAYNTNSTVTDATATMTTHTTEDDTEEWTLTGYKRHPVGILIHGLVIFVMLGIQFLLFLLTIFYYMQQGAITRWAPVFQDEVQVLMAFEIVWMVGIVWCFAFCYPSSIRDLFLRRCDLAKATFVAVYAPLKQVEKSVGNNDSNKEWGALLMGAFWKPFDVSLRCIFSYPYTEPGYETVFCPVTTDVSTGKRGFYFRLRRYVYAPVPVASESVSNTKMKEEDGEDLYVAHSEEGMAFQQGKIQVGSTLGDFLLQAKGLTTEEAIHRFGSTGPNSIPVKKPTIFGSIITEFSRPFYLYQNFMLWTWGPYWYYYMMITNTIVRVTGGVVVGVFQYMSDSVLFKLSHAEGTSIVLRDGEQVEIPNAGIVPGDVVVLKPGIVSCDMVIVSAERLVVDESALTGEANPVVKVPIDPIQARDKYNPYKHKMVTLSAGTDIVEVGEEGGNDLGLVMATGSFTSKGRLLSDVLAYQRHKFKFDDEVKIVLCILALEAIFLIGMVFYFIDLDQWVYAWFYAVFVLATVIPPLLPTVFVVSVGISAKRLQKKRITCTNQEGILVAGKVNTAFFDKTGTLTKQGMDFISVEAATPELEAKLKIGMAVCHTLYHSSNGQLIGNHVESCAFIHTGAELSHTRGSSIISLNNHSYEVVKRYEFDTHRVTQSVVVQGLDGQRTVFVKGSAEAIRPLCSTGIPSNFDESTHKAAKSGVYQLAMAFKELETGTEVDMSRDALEKDLQFGGFLSFQNLMRENTPDVIQELKLGSVTVAMITGDNVLTGICIARESDIIEEGRQVSLARLSGEEVGWTDADSGLTVERPRGKLLSEADNITDLAITGEAWTTLLQDDPKYAASIAPHIRVFGRCNPSDKVSVVSHFVQHGKKTLMCGDGGNDCGSLKSAHVGVALSTSEASIVAPFTSLDKDVAAVVEVLREGRCALASAFAAYSYYIIWGQGESFLQVINAYFAITFTEFCWVFLDGVWSILMAFSLPLAKSAKVLSASRPTASLLGPRTMFSVCGMIAWNFIFLVIGLATLFNQDWFQCRQWGSTDVSNIAGIGDNYETSLLFIVGGSQFISSAIALNFGYTWREHFLKNYVFVFLATLFATMQIIATLYPSSFSCIWRLNCENEDVVPLIVSPYRVAIQNPWNTTLMPSSFQWKLIGIMVGNGIVLCLWQYFFVNGYLAKKVAGKKANLEATTEAALNVSKINPIDVTKELSYQLSNVSGPEKTDHEETEREVTA